MKVILIHNVPGLGKVDEIKEVADGYARNYLFVKNLAVPASKNGLEAVNMRQSKKKKKSEKELVSQQEIAAKADGKEYELRERVSKVGSLYAAVGPARIVSLLKNDGIKANKKQVVMKQIKEVGEYKIKLNLGHGIEAEFKVVVMSK